MISESWGFVTVISQTIIKPNKYAFHHNESMLPTSHPFPRCPWYHSSTLTPWTLLLGYYSPSSNRPIYFSQSNALPVLSHLQKLIELHPSPILPTSYCSAPRRTLFPSPFCTSPGVHLALLQPSTPSPFSPQVVRLPNPSFLPWLWS